jgi:hypothetical protein
MRSNVETARQLSVELRSLLDSEDRGVPVRAWCVEAEVLQHHIRADPEMCNLVPHFVWHWLSDADVRKKAPEVAVLQSARIRAMIQVLEQGTWPE